MKALLIVLIAVLALSLGSLADEAKPKGNRELPLAGTDGITKPRLIKRSRAQPELSLETWRKIKGRAHVALQIVVETDGKVGEATAVFCSQRGLGLEESAIRAVKKWRYKPAKKDGRPLAVYFTAAISFTWHGDP